jgi:hypothetical protein
VPLVLIAGTLPDVTRECEQGLDVLCEARCASPTVQGDSIHSGRLSLYSLFFVNMISHIEFGQTTTASRRCKICSFHSRPHVLNESHGAELRYYGHRRRWSPQRSMGLPERLECRFDTDTDTIAVV